MNFDVLIMGSGVTASALAALLVRREIAASGRVAIVADAAVAPVSAPGWGLRVFALSRSSQRLLAHCGAWQSLPSDRVNAYERMCVWEARGGLPRGGPPLGGPPPDGVLRGEVPARGSLTFDSAELGEPNLGFIVEGGALQDRCRFAADAAGAVFIDAGVTGIEVDDSSVRLALRDGRTLKGRLLVAADGADSPARRLLGIDTAGHAYHQDALVAHVRTERPHANTAWQRFLPSGPLAFLPLPDGRSSIVWSVGREEGSRLRGLDPADFGKALDAASDAILGACTLTTPLASFPLRLQYALEYVRPRAVLVGDAAHVVHPLAGQGLNLGLLDCAVLAETLSEHGGADVFGELRVLRRYERRRRSENLLAAAALDGLERLFAQESAVLSRLRIGGLKAVSRLPLVKNELALRALGIRGDVPAFLRS